MRELASADRIRRFMEALDAVARSPGRVYLTGGGTAVLMGWRDSTIDVDLKLVPEQDELLRAIPELKNRLHLNVELASPADFIPVIPEWQDRSPFIAQYRHLSFYHFDLYAQALAKVERGHPQDLTDVRELLDRALIRPAEALVYFGRIEPELYRFPAVDAPSFRRAVEAAFGGGAAERPEHTLP
ncbi:MAG: hypothetical protein HY700_20395 [Gemmatimonadetes bacterium]|nr:hypothetical protein [Gemmatimonadota bacterium]